MSAGNTKEQLHACLSPWTGAAVVIEKPEKSDARSAFESHVRRLGNFFLHHSRLSSAWFIDEGQEYCLRLIGRSVNRHIGQEMIPETKLGKYDDGKEIWMTIFPPDELVPNQDMTDPDRNFAVISTCSIFMKTAPVLTIAGGKFRNQTIDPVTILTLPPGLDTPETIGGYIGLPEDMFRIAVQSSPETGIESVTIRSQLASLHCQPLGKADGYDLYVAGMVPKASVSR